MLRYAIGMPTSDWELRYPAVFMRNNGHEYLTLNLHGAAQTWIIYYTPCVDEAELAYL